MPVFSRPDFDRATPTEEAAEESARATLRPLHPGARVEVAIRICCPAIASTELPCSLPWGHKGPHYVESKQHEFHESLWPEGA